MRDKVNEIEGMVAQGEGLTGPDRSHDYDPLKITIDLADSTSADTPPQLVAQLETVLRPRDAFFCDAEQVPLGQAAGRVSAELVTPYPPGVPAIAPGERITEPVLDYLRTGLKAGMKIPDAADPRLETPRVVPQAREAAM